MKRILILLLLISISRTCFSQSSDSVAHLTKADYLRKSRNQKKAARLLTAGAVTIACVAIGRDAYNSLSHESPSTGLYMTSAGMLLGGIILFKASSHNRNRAEAVSLFVNIENAPTCRQSIISKKQFPAIGLSIHLR